jgi:UDP-glucuronate 4-epimerase
MKVLVTGSAGFIGSHLAIKLLDRGDEVFGIDNLNDYYDVKLKKARLERVKKYSAFTDLRADIEDHDSIKNIFEKYKPQRVVNLAAQAGVRYSLTNPYAYINSNIMGFTNILENCRRHNIEHLVYASSSSVYGGNEKLPFSEHHSVDHPVSLYAATKKANELMAHSYSQLFGLPTTGLRFFTVYGPWGRPDMALFLFANAMLKGESIEVFNNGNMIRDFTYIDDIIEGVIRVLDKIATSNDKYDAINPDPASSNAPYRLFNIGNSQPTALMKYISALENSLNIEAKKIFLPMQLGDVQATSADVSELKNWVNFKPNTDIDVGVKRFVEWYKEYYA